MRIEVESMNKMREELNDMTVELDPLVENDAMWIDKISLLDSSDS